MLVGLQTVGLALLAAPGAAFSVSTGRRHTVTALTAKLAPVGADAAFPAPQADSDTWWSRWPVLPLAPYARRKTVAAEVVPGRVWTFDQLQGTLYVHVPVRMTVVKLGAPGSSRLFVFAPVAPTQECLRAVRALEEEHGKVLGEGGGLVQRSLYSLEGKRCHSHRFVIMLGEGPHRRPSGS